MIRSFLFPAMALLMLSGTANAAEIVAIIGKMMVTSDRPTAERQVHGNEVIVTFPNGDSCTLNVSTQTRSGRCAGVTLQPLRFTQ